MPHPSYSRRQVLRRGSATTLLGTLTGISGCSAPNPDANANPDLPNYATWAPAPDRLFGDTEDQGDTGVSSQWYPIHAQRFDELAAYRDRRGESFEDTPFYRDGNAHPVLDIDPSEAGTEIRAGGRGVSVLETDLSEDEIIEAFQTPDSRDPIRDPVEPIGEHEGYRLLSTADESWVIGVNNGQIVEAFVMGQDPFFEKRGVVEALIDARAGDGRYVDADATLEQLVERLGTGMIVTIRPPVPDSQSSTENGEQADPIASGVAYASSETENARQVLVFASRDAADGFAETPNTYETRTWSAVTVTREDRFISIDGTHHPV